MKLTGIIEQTFRGQVLFRGFATLSNLAKISKGADYQRDVDERRLNEISDYYNSSSYMFFPELLLGWYIDDGMIMRNLNDMALGSFQTTDGIKFKKAKYTLPEANYIVGENPTTKTFTIEIPEDIVSRKIFNRIDGNHRLSAIDKIIIDNADAEIGKVIVPYSVLLQFATTEQYSEMYAKKNETAYFYLINSKAKALSTNENLKALLQDDLFTDSEKESLLAINLNQIHYIQDIADYLENSKIGFISDIFLSETYVFAYQFVIEGISKDQEYTKEETDKIIKSIELVNCCYVKEKIKITHQDIILACSIMGYQQSEKFEEFLAWINTNEVDKIEKLSSGSIIQLYTNIHKQRSYKVFVAMPYISFKRVNEFNTLFKEALADISKQIGFGLELIPIMRFRGESQRIDTRLRECIKKCDIFVADLTTVNDNVIFEVGVAEGNNKKILLRKAEEDTKQLPFDKVTKMDKDKKIPFDFDKLQYIPYSNSGYYNEIKRILKNNIPIIVEQLKKEKHA